MKYRNNCGQEAIEFVLVCALIFVATVFGFMIMGDKLAGFFMNDSATVKVASQSAPVINASSSLKYGQNYTTAATVSDKPLYEKQYTLSKVGSVEVSEYPDGSLSFEVAGQQVAISSKIVDLQKTVSETTGSSSWQDLVSNIAYLIENNKDAYPDGNVPVEIAFGTGNRKNVIYGGFMQSDETAVYQGDAEVNMTALKVGDQMIIFQTDQKCTATSSGGCAYQGSYRIEGTIDQNNTFKGDVTSNVTSHGETSGTFTAKNIDLSNGLNIGNAVYYHYDDYYKDEPLESTWNFEANNPDYFFKL
jgi:hypothetical protein